MNLNSVLRITARVTGVRQFTKLDRAIKKTEKAAREAEKGFKQMLDSRLFRTAAAAAAGLATSLGLSTKAAIDFESSMAEVLKVVSGIDTPEGIQEIRSEILGLSKEIPIAASGFADIYAAAGQAGIPREQIKAFAEEVAKTAVAFDMTAEQAGQSMAKIMASMGMTLPEVSSLTDAINHLSTNMRGSAAQFTEFVVRSGQIGQSVGMSATETAAFGAAMIAAGAEADVASTSFRRMITQLASGPSMTDRQIDALVRLGYAIDNAVVNEEQYTEEARAESESRIAIARNETDQLAKELNRRFRDQMTQIRDQLSDESAAVEEAAQDRLDDQITVLQRRQRAEIDAARKRFENNKAGEQREIYRIQDYYDEQIDALRDNHRDQAKQRQRAERDRLTAIQDSMNDRRQLELAGLESNYQETKNKEEALLKERIAAIEAAAEAGSAAIGEQLAANLQQDAIGTIQTIFDQIRALPKEAQVSVIKDLFGEEAMRGILPLINNVDLLSQALTHVGDQAAFAGSKNNEFMVRLGTTSAQMQLAKNELTALAISFGSEVTEALKVLLPILSNFINGLAAFIEKNPQVAAGLAVLSGAFIGLVAILPALGALVTIIGAIGGKAALFGGVAAAIGGIKTAILAVGAVLTGPLGLAALLGVAIGTAYTFRGEIGKVFSNVAKSIGTTLQALGRTFNVGFQGIYNFVSGIFRKLFDFYNTTFIQPVIAAAQQLQDNLTQIFQRLPEAFKAPFVAAITSVKSILNMIVQSISRGINGAIRLLNNVIRGANRLPTVNIPLVPSISIPEFAEGGMVTGPTLGLVGEAGPEYIVPARKAEAFAQNYLAGIRGPAAIPRFAEGGFVSPSANVSIQTGPVTRMNGQNFVTTQEMSAAVQAGVEQTLDLIQRDGMIRAGLSLS